MGTLAQLRPAALSAVWILQTLCAAQWTTGPKMPCNERVHFKVFADTMLVRGDLHDTKHNGKAYGAVHVMGWWANRTGHYPGNRNDLPENRILTTDTAFKRGSDHMLTGVFQFFYRNGTLMQEYVFNDGYILSDKRYRPDGSLALWLDYDIDYDGCLFSYYAQQCHQEKERTWTTESIFTFIDQRPRDYRLGFAMEAKRRGWIMK